MDAATLRAWLITGAGADLIPQDPAASPTAAVTFTDEATACAGGNPTYLTTRAEYDAALKELNAIEYFTYWFDNTYTTTNADCADPIFADLDVCNP